MSNLQHFKDRLREIAIQLLNISKGRTFSTAFTLDEQHSGDFKTESLECHARQFIDLFLQGLGWHVLSMPTEQILSMSREVAIRPPNDERRWMDYLGYERDCHSPLLHVEAKRLRSVLPTKGRHTGLPSGHPFCDIIRRFVERKHKGCSLEDSRAGLQLDAEWAEYIAKQIVYLDGLKHSALRVPPVSVITNGDWLLTFIKPEDLLCEAACSGAEIRIYDSIEQVLKYAEQVFDDLSFVGLSGRSGPVLSSDLLHVVDPSQIASVSRGIEVVYHENHVRRFAPQPCIYMTPIVGLISQDKRIVLVSDANEKAPVLAPTQKRPEEYAALQKASDQLLEAVFNLLGKRLPILSVEELERSAPRNLYREISSPLGYRNFVYLTGDLAYLLNPGAAANCAAHSRDARSDWLTTSLLVVIPATNPKTMFHDEDGRFCCHRGVSAAKDRLRSVNSPSNLAERRQSICLLKQFEEYACCQSCAYIRVCGVAEGLSLPCGSNGL